jgi:hypothetical protein
MVDVDSPLPEEIPVHPLDVVRAVAGYKEFRIAQAVDRTTRVPRRLYLNHLGAEGRAIIDAIRKRDSRLVLLEQEFREALGTGYKARALELVEVEIATVLDH